MKTAQSLCNGSLIRSFWVVLGAQAFWSSALSAQDGGSFARVDADLKVYDQHIADLQATFEKVPSDPRYMGTITHRGQSKYRYSSGVHGPGNSGRIHVSVRRDLQVIAGQPAARPAL